MDSRIQKLEEKVIDLETNLGLLQHDFESQNEMVLLYSKKIDNLERALKRMTMEMERAEAARSEPPRSLEDEKPPHY